jgi:hypothetical protein
MKREVIRVLWELREFHEDETLLRYFAKYECVRNWDMKLPLRRALVSFWIFMTSSAF